MKITTDDKLYVVASLMVGYALWTLVENKIAVALYALLFIISLIKILQLRQVINEVEVSEGVRFSRRT